MANTYKFTLSGSKVLVEVFDQTPTLIDNFTLSTEHNVFTHPNKNLTVLVSQNTNYQGTDAVTYEFNIGQITDNPTPTDEIATVTWLANNFFVGTSGGAGGATEATLLSVLNAVVASDQDIEILLVRDTVTEEVFQQITNYETGTPVVEYKDVNGTLINPLPNPVEYLDASAVLNLILTELQGGLDVTLPTGTNTTDQYTVTVSTGSPIAAGFKKVSIANLGTSNATVQGNTLEPGFAINFEAEEGKSLDEIDYTAGASFPLKIVTIA